MIFFIIAVIVASIAFAIVSGRGDVAFKILMYVATAISMVILVFFGCLWLYTDLIFTLWNR